MMGASVLVIGGGGREHALVWKLCQSSSVETIYVAPGSDAIRTLDKVSPKYPQVDVTDDYNEVRTFCTEHDVGLVVIGPEEPLARGIADKLQSIDVSVFGPKAAAARIESDKSWAKGFMEQYGILTARWCAFTDGQQAKEYIKAADFPAWVIKASGLAAGKGVVVASNVQEACQAIDELRSTCPTAAERIVVEERLEGYEISVLAFCDGRTVHLMPPAQDHKRALDGDLGPNTGGMGAYCPCPMLSELQIEFVRKNIMQKAMDGFRADGVEFVGVLYAGLMISPDDSINVLEFNCRFGDPECEVLLPLLQSDLYDVMRACCERRLDAQTVRWRTDAYAVGVVLASRGYPASSSKGDCISGLELLTDSALNMDQDQWMRVFHCGTRRKPAPDNDKFETNGGRVLIAVSIGRTLIEAAAQATRMARDWLRFDGKQFRCDIGHKGFARSILNGCLDESTYKASGVDITAGNSLVQRIKNCARTTHRAGLVGGLGGFGGVFDLDQAGYGSGAMLVSGCDGVGTKLKVAQAMGKHNTIGIDLVAMCVNDILAHGAEPLFFLDYYACGKLDVGVAEMVVQGVATGCRQAGCALIGGETAEMPQMYATDEYDVAGFAVGAVTADAMLPRSQDICDGDVVIGLPSSGLHSNGFSLVRRIVERAGLQYDDPVPFASESMTLGDELLKPTRIYVKDVLPLMQSQQRMVKAFAHITGGGLVENLPRVLSAEHGQHLYFELDATKWIIPPVFGWLAAVGHVSSQEMLRTFNCGVGAVLLSSAAYVPAILKQIPDARIIGAVRNNSVGCSTTVQVRHFKRTMERIMQPFMEAQCLERRPALKRVAVLLSGTGTNFETLYKACRDRPFQMNAEVVLVISNRPGAGGLDRARRVGVPTVIIKHTDYDSRELFDDAISQVLVRHQIDIVCLAGFMRLLSAEFTQKWHGRLLNIHPSLLPLFKGAHAQRDALLAGVKVTGCTVHFVTVEMDAGPIIVQEPVSIARDDTEHTLTEKIKSQAECKAYPEALRLLANNLVSLDKDNNCLKWA